MTHYTSRPLSIAPFIEITEVSDTNERTPITLDPELAATPKQVKFSRSLSHGAFVYDVRRELTPGIGNPNESVPPTGIRVFSPEDKYLLFGGDAGVLPLLYHKVGPGYQQFTTAILPVAPSYILHAAMTAQPSRISMVTSDAPNDVKLLTMGESDFALDTTVLGAGAVTSIEFSPEGDLIIIRYGDTYALANLDGSLLANPHPGSLLAVSPDGAFYVFDTLTDTDPLEAYSRAGSVFTKVSDLPETLGTDRRAKFSPDSAILEVSSNTIVASDFPKFLTYHGDSFRSAGGEQKPAAAREFADVIFSDDSEWMLNGYKEGNSNIELYRRSTFDAPPEATFLPDLPNLPTNDVRATEFSPDGTYLALGCAASPYLIIYKRAGDVFTRLPGPAMSPGGPVYSFSWSPDSTYLAMAFNDAPYVRLYSRSGDTFTKLAEPDVLPGTFCNSVTFSPDGLHLAVGAVTGPKGIVYKRVADAFTKLPDLPAFNKLCYAVAYSGDGSLLAVAGGEGSDGLVRLYSRSGDTYTALAGFQQPSNPPGRVMCIRFNADHLLVGHTNSPFLSIYKANANGWWTPVPSPFDTAPSGPVSRIAIDPVGSGFVIGDNVSAGLSFYGRDGDTYSRLGDPAVTPSASVASLSHSPDGKNLAVGLLDTPYIQVYKWGTEVVTLPTYELSFAQSAIGTNVPALWAISPDGVAHYGTDTANWHKETVVPNADVDPLAFDAAYAAAQISRVQYSPTGRRAIYDTPDGPSVAVKSSSQDYIKLSELDGTFVSIYARGEGDVFEEQGFVAHGDDADVKDLVFSSTPQFFSYFALNTVVDPNSSQGRHVYHIPEGEMNLVGVEYDPMMERSFLAFSPFEGYFAATYRMTDLNHFVALYKFDVDGTFAEVDRESVLFGPLDFSSCEDIIVAHGGANPFTLYKRGGDTLLLQDYPLVDWSHEGLILDVAVLPDCSALVVLTPEKIIVVDKDDTNEELETVDEAPLDETAEDGSGLDLSESGDEAYFNEPGGYSGGGGGGGGGGGWTINPGHGLDPLYYVPYATVHVHYRV